MNPNVAYNLAQKRYAQIVYNVGVKPGDLHQLDLIVPGKDLSVKPKQENIIPLFAIEIL